MILPYLLTNLDFAAMFRLISPNFFKVVSPTVMFKIAGQLKNNYSDTHAWEELRLRTLSSIQKAELATNRQPGELALQLFFYQILSQDTWILDFRAEAFNQGKDKMLSWNPKPLYYKISPGFLQGVRELYRGFYGEDDALFDSALASLGLLAAKNCLKNHFGQGDQTSVNFKLQTFQNTFTEVFSVCKREGIHLQPEFFVLGLMLLTLYQNLESRGEPQNARQCFAEAYQKATAR